MALRLTNNLCIHIPQLGEPWSNLINDRTTTRNYCSRHQPSGHCSRVVDKIGNARGSQSTSRRWWPSAVSSSPRKRFGLAWKVWSDLWNSPKPSSTVWQVTSRWDCHPNQRQEVLSMAGSRPGCHCQVGDVRFRLYRTVVQFSKTLLLSEFSSWFYPTMLTLPSAKSWD